MQPLTRLLNPFKQKKKVLDLSEFASDRIGWHSISVSDTVGHYRKFKDDQYENGFSSITKIANRFAKALPQGIGENGEIDNTLNVMSRLYYPNTDMSGYDFREALAIMYLVHPEFYVIVHTAEGVDDVREDNITGFTFFEGTVTRNPETKKREYKLEDGTVIDPKRVIVIGGFNPYNVTKGFSPSQAARRWTRLDDLIAEYQTGFFSNGAVPAGQFIVRTKTATEFNDIVDRLQAKHKGASNSGNVTYTHEPLDVNGKPMGASIEWIPFSQNNKDLSMAELFQQANKKIDSVYGVPASIRAVNDNNTYASVRVDQQIFIEETVQPIAIKIWGKMTHQLNKMTGGLGISIYCEIEVPNVADEEKVIAEKKKIEGDLIANMLNAGFTLSAIVEGFELDDSLLKLGEPNPQPVEEEPAVAEPTDISSAPEQKAIQPCDHSHEEPKKKVISEGDYNKYTLAVADVVRRQLQKQVNQAISELPNELSKAIGDTEPYQDEEFAGELLRTLTPLVLLYGAIQNSEGQALLLSSGLSVQDVSPFQFTALQREKYSKYLQKIANYFNEQTAQDIRNVIARGQENAWTVQQYRDGLNNLVQDEYRVRRLAVSEVNRAGNRASLASMEEIVDSTGYDVYKVWTHGLSDAPCEFCKAFIGTKIPVKDAFIDLNTAITGEDGGVLVNNFVTMDTPEMHPFCHCNLTYVVE